MTTESSSIVEVSVHSSQGRSSKISSDQAVNQIAGGLGVAAPRKNFKDIGSKLDKFSVFFSYISLMQK